MGEKRAEDYGKTLPMSLGQPLPTRPHHCERCGAKLEWGESTLWHYSDQTGAPLYKWVLRCPNYKPGNSHTLLTVYHDPMLDYGPNYCPKAEPPALVGEALNEAAVDRIRRRLAGVMGDEGLHGCCCITDEGDGWSIQAEGAGGKTLATGMTEDLAQAIAYMPEDITKLLRERAVLLGLLRRACAAMDAWGQEEDGIPDRQCLGRGDYADPWAVYVQAMAYLGLAVKREAATGATACMDHG